MRGQEARRQRRAHAVAEHRHLRRPGRLERLPGEPRQDLRHRVLHREAIVLGAEHAPVDEVEVEALLGHVLDEGCLGHQVEDVRPADPEIRHEEQRGAVGALGGVPPEPRLVLAVDLLPRGGPDLGLLRVHHHLAPVLHPEEIAARVFIEARHHFRGHGRHLGHHREQFVSHVLPLGAGPRCSSRAPSARVDSPTSLRRRHRTAT